MELFVTIYLSMSRRDVQVNKTKRVDYITTIDRLIFWSNRIRIKVKLDSIRFVRSSSKTRPLAHLSAPRIHTFDNVSLSIFRVQQVAIGHYGIDKTKVRVQANCYIDRRYCGNKNHSGPH